MTINNSVNYDDQGVELIDSEPRANFDDDFEAAALIPNFTPLKKDGVLIGCIVKNQGLAATHFIVLATQEVASFPGSKHMRPVAYDYETGHAHADAQEIEHYNEAWDSAINDLGVEDERG